MNNFRALIAAVALSLTASPALARPVAIDQIGSVNDRSILKAGDYGWNDTDLQPGPVSIKVNLRTQMVYVYRGDMMIGLSNISSGRDGFETPTGRFVILGKEDNHFSKKYKADMPFTMWINDQGVAFHSGSTPGRTSSHGCVHLPSDFAEKLYQIVDRGVTVTIIDSAAPSKLDSLF